MQDTTFQALLSRALHPATGAPEATASMGRVLADAEARKRLADMLADDADTVRRDRDELRARYDHNREELLRAMAEIERLRASTGSTSRSRSTSSSRPSSNGSGGQRRRPKPIVELDAPATCFECGSDLEIGDRARCYPGGRVYGADCHGGRR